MLRILTKEVHIQMRNYGVVTLVKCGLSSLLTFNIDSWAPILTNFLLSVGLLDNHGVNPYMRLSFNLGQNKMEQQTPNHPPPPPKKKTENPVPQSFFALKPNGNACYAGCPLSYSSLFISHAYICT